MALSPLLERYDQLIIDLDGCVWIGDQPVEGSVEALERLRVAGKRIAFATNNSRRTSEDYVRKLWRRAGEVPVWSPQARQALESYEYPGNVRELEHLVQRACILATGPVMGLVLLPQVLTGSKQGAAVVFR